MSTQQQHSRDPSRLDKSYGWIIFAGVVAYIAVGGWLLLWVPGALIQNWVPDVTQTEDRNKLLGAAGQIVLFSLGGVIAAVGVGLSLSRKRDETKAAERDQDRLAIDRDANFTARYTEAIAQLGSEYLAIRLGGVYALERIAQDSDRDHGVIVEVLAAYIRNDGKTRRFTDDSPGRDPEDRWSGDRPEDVAAAISVLSRIVTGTPRLRLNGADLREADFSGVNLTNAVLSGADLTSARLSKAKLDSAHFDSAILFGADLTAATLSDARLFDVTLAGANLSRADLTRAVLSVSSLWNTQFDFATLHNAQVRNASVQDSSFNDADLTGADLTGTTLQTVDLRGANLTDIITHRTRLREIKWDSSTIWPASFTPPASVTD
ncbi:MAG: pentapeptide repeat-containing protein [Actinobacteria bacterium]|nr:pentapeptide repeat-containing protein [Actinomycetota bacterium]